MKRTVFTLLLMLGLGAPATMCAELTGKVTDRQGTALVGVSVTTDVAGVGTQTGSDGTYKLTLSDDMTRVTFSSVGFQARQFKIKDVDGDEYAFARF